ncbi:MAG: hypothetical protein ACRD3W_25615, partial [Terriglobales bacterium]
MNWNWKLVLNPFFTGCGVLNQEDPTWLPVASVSRSTVLDKMWALKFSVKQSGPDAKFEEKLGEASGQTAHAAVLPPTSNNPVITATTKNLDVPTFILPPLN